MASPQTIGIFESYTCGGPPRQFREQLQTYRLVRDLCWIVLNGGERPTPENLLRAAGVRWTVDSDELGLIPRRGPALLTANCLPGVINLLLLAAELPKARPDMRILANYLIARVHGLESVFIPIHPWRSRRAFGMNRRALCAAVELLRSGGALAVFPAGGPAIGQKLAANGSLAWSTTTPRLARTSGAAAVPVSIAECAGGEFKLRIGTPIPAERLAVIGNHQEAASYLRWKTGLLARSEDVPVRLVPRTQSGVALMSPPGRA